MPYHEIYNLYETYGPEDYFNHLRIDQKAVLDHILEGLHMVFPEFSRFSRTKQLQIAGLVVEAFLKGIQG
ncbi:MAG: hypothetical protein ACFFFG_11895 [Candidatus Thorarchaeota archaeon]